VGVLEPERVHDKWNAWFAKAAAKSA